MLGADVQGNIQQLLVGVLFKKIPQSLWIHEVKLLLAELWFEGSQSFPSTINPLFGWIALKLPIRMPPCGVPSPSLLKATVFKKSTQIGVLLSP